MDGIKVNLLTGEIKVLEHVEHPRIKRGVEPKSQKKIVIVIEKKIKILKRRKLKPTFVRDPLQWARKIFGENYAYGKVPPLNTEEYGLYKYGEWLFYNEKYKTYYDKKS